MAVFFFVHTLGGILVPRPQIKLMHGVLATGPPGKCLGQGFRILNIKPTRSVVSSSVTGARCWQIDQPTFRPALAGCDRIRLCDSVQFQHLHVGVDGRGSTNTHTKPTVLSVMEEGQWHPLSASPYSGPVCGHKATASHLNTALSY